MENFKINIGSLRNWKKGDLPSAAHWDEVVQALQRIAAVGLPSQVLNGGSKFQVALFRVLRLETDVIICNFYNGVSYDEDEEIKVAMPFLLRKTPFDSEGEDAPELRKGRFSYTFLFTDDDTGEPRFDKRTSIDTLDDDDEEIQVITAAYDVGDIIFAMRGVFGGTGLYHDDAKEVPILWQDMDQSRMWAKSSEVEE